MTYAYGMPLATKDLHPGAQLKGIQFVCTYGITQMEECSAIWEFSYEQYPQLKQLCLVFGVRGNPYENVL